MLKGADYIELPLLRDYRRGGSAVSYLIELKGVLINDHMMSGSYIAKQGFVDSGTTFTYLPQKLWDSLMSHFDYFCDEGKSFKRADGSKKYCHGERFTTNS